MFAPICALQSKAKPGAVCVWGDKLCKLWGRGGLTDDLSVFDCDYSVCGVCVVTHVSLLYVCSRHLAARRDYLTRRAFYRSLSLWRCLASVENVSQFRPRAEDGGGQDAGWATAPPPATRYPCGRTHP